MLYAAEVASKRHPQMTQADTRCLPVNEGLLLICWIELGDEVFEASNDLRFWPNILLFSIALEGIIYATLCTADTLASVNLYLHPCFERAEHGCAPSKAIARYCVVY